MTPEEFFNAVLAKVESQSIREWATSAHNQPLFLTDIGEYMAKQGVKADPDRYTIKLVSMAIGMW